MLLLLNETRRNEILGLLSETQREVIYKHYKHNMKAMLFDIMHNQSKDWRFVDFKVNPDYLSSNEADKLYCECGREVKYQYILYSVQKDQYITLGINHLKMHTHLDNKRVKQIKSYSSKVNQWLDEILIQNEVYKQNTHIKLNIRDMYRSIIDMDAEIIRALSDRTNTPITSQDMVMIRDFYDYDLTLPTYMKQRIEKIVEYPRSKLYKECQSVVNELFKHQEKIPFDLLYDNCSETIDILMLNQNKETVIKDLVKYLNLRSRYRIKWEDNYITYV